MATISEAMTAYGMNYSAALARFSGNEELLLSFLRSFPEEGYLDAICAARETGDKMKYQAAVHALKGTAGGLSLTPLYQAASEMMDALRAGDDKLAEGLLPQLLGEYQQACLAIEGALPR